MRSLEGGEGRPEAIMRCRELRVGYGGKSILPPINLSIYAGDFIAVVGANGAGKSTWFRTALGLSKPISGRIERGSSKTRISYLPQRASFDPLLPMTAKRVVHWGRLRGWSFLTPWSSARDRSAVRSSMELANCEEFCGARFADLSGGQQQRVLFAQLVASEADLVFLDEPTASMDLVSERETYERLASLCRTQGVAVVVITHSIQGALEYADRFVFLHSGTTAGASPTPGIAAVGSASEIQALPAFQEQFGYGIAEANCG